MFNTRNIPRKCPCCGNIITKHDLDQCPVCGINGLSQIFLTREDRNEWVKSVVVPFQIERGLDKPLTVSVGKYHVIALFRGRLYGIGGNKCGQLMNESAESIINEPMMIASGIRSAAASQNYTLMVDMDGALHILGRSNKGFEEKDKSVFLNDKIQEVYACSVSNSFWSVTSSNQVFFWGIRYKDDKVDKLGLFPEVKEQKVLFTFSDPVSYECIPAQVEERRESGHPVYHTLRGESYEYKPSDSYFIHSKVFSKYSGMYGNANIGLEFKKNDNHTYRADIVLYDHVVYHPMRVYVEPQKLREHIHLINHHTGSETEEMELNLKQYIENF